MKLKKQIKLLFIVGLLPLALFSQEKSSANSSVKENENSFKFDKLNVTNNTADKFQKAYEQGAVAYNKGVELITNANFDLDVLGLQANMSRTIEQFNLAKPYFEEAHQLNPKDKNTLQGLVGIYFAIADKEKCLKYKKELDELTHK
jgi:tetratricopeptide (TPR) repeat protein